MNQLQLKCFAVLQQINSVIHESKVMLLIVTKRMILMNKFYLKPGYNIIYHILEKMVNHVRI